jgi:hypothetical protein
MLSQRYYSTLYMQVSSHSVEPNLMNSEILKKNWEPEEIRESQLNDKNKNSYATVYPIKKGKRLSLIMTLLNIAKLVRS